MSEALMQRVARTVPVTLTTALESSNTLRVDGFAGGSIIVDPLEGSSGSLALYASASPEGPYYAVYKADGSSVSVAMSHGSATGGVYALPDEIYYTPYVRIVAGNSAAQGVSAVVTLKS